MKPCWKKVKEKENVRKIKANDPLYNASFSYSSNHISTSKYNFLTFLPKNLFEQFRRIANTYFFVLLILQLIPEISSLTPLTTVIPLVAVLAISAIKDAVDDIQRHNSDNQVNNRLTWVLVEGKLSEKPWHNIVVGDIIRMENNQFVAADLLILSSSEPNGLCYVETSELDGETNLKVRQALTVTAELENDITNLSLFNGEIICEAPNNRLNNFEGKLTWKKEEFSLNNNHILLRGCMLRNTKCCYGLVVFAGRDTKLMMNSGKTTFKRTHIDRLMNFLIFGIFIFLLISCFFCMVGSGIWESAIGFKFQLYLPWESFVPGSVLKTDDHTPNVIILGSMVKSLMVFLSYFIVLNTVVPISLYVSVEMIRFGHSWWINWDERMYHAKTNTYARSRTTTLNEELGQIKYIFSDKTGTLTQNVMTFDKCTINGVVYGYLFDALGNTIEITERTEAVDFSANPMYDPMFRFYDEKLWDAVKSGNPHVHLFFRLLALCHTVMPEEKDGVLEYQAQSPDEGALVSAARNFGFVFKGRTPDSITIEALGHTEVHDLLCILDFNNTRKRMSVILKKDKRITLYCKGADNTIFPLLSRKSNYLKDKTTGHLNEFAQSGLRTLCCAFKEINENDYDAWKVKYSEASNSIGNREEKLSYVYEEIEQDMILIGATAIEDQLQDGVVNTICHLSEAGIKLWVLTGDKQETAINIGYSCRLLSEDMDDILLIDSEDEHLVISQLKQAERIIEKATIKNREIEIKELENDVVTKKPPEKPNVLLVQPENVLPDFEKQDMMAYSNGNISLLNKIADVEKRDLNPQLEDTGGFALIINGHSLVHALTKENEDLLVNVACQCRVVICCRVTPLQKALVVDLIRQKKHEITLAIGDGANDVSMIKMAHIGVGISGQEGMQAVLASDFALAQFRFLERLLLVHGRWSYLRMCKFLRYFFYKNFAFTLCHLWYAFYCGFSAQTLYDEAFISLYNVCYTSLPILALGIFDQDVNDVYSIRHPRLYQPGHLDLLFNKRVFVRSVTEGIISSLILFFVPYLSFSDAVKPNGQDIAGHKAFGTMVSSSLIVTVTLRCALDTYYWTGFNHFVIWGSIVFYFVFTFVFYSPLFDYTYLGTSINVMGTANFFFTLILTVTILLLPVVASRFYNISLYPTLSEIIRLRQQKVLRSRSKDMVLRRASTSRRSQRSMRSGYAFAHQEGFGKLITSGSIMKPIKKARVSTASSLKSCLPIGSDSSKRSSKNLSTLKSPNILNTQISENTSSVFSVTPPILATFDTTPEASSITFDTSPSPIDSTQKPFLSTENLKLNVRL